MKPVVLSTKENAQNKFGWQRDGFNISYFKNNISKVINIYLYIANLKIFSRKVVVWELHLIIHYHSPINLYMIKIQFILLNAIHIPTLT